jgi:uncharacterized protein
MGAGTLTRSLAGLVLLLAIATGLGPARAENDNMRSTLIESLRNRPALTQRPPAPVYRSPAQQVRRAPSTFVVRDAPGHPPVEPTTFITVFGDSLAELLAGGLADAYADNEAIEVTRRTRSSSGLVRTDFHDWNAVVRDYLAATDKLTVAVIMMGSNDRQTLKDASGAALEPLSDAWKEAYAARVADLMRPFAEKGVPVVWVGMPIMESPRFAADMLMLNEVIRTAVRNAGGTYVDLWEPFADEQNRYSVSGPDMNGDIVKLRAADGIHFTKAGARKAAHFVEVEIKRILDRQPQPEATIALPADTAADPASTDPALQPGGVERLIDQIARSGIDGDPLPNLSLPQKPAAGPIVPLNAFEMTEGATLLKGPLTLGRSDAGRLVERVLVQGQSPDPKPGRADDFRWPAANEPAKP